MKGRPHRVTMSGAARDDRLRLVSIVPGVERMSQKGHLRPSAAWSVTGCRASIPDHPSLATGNLQAREGISLAFQRFP